MKKHHQQSVACITNSKTQTTCLVIGSLIESPKKLKKVRQVLTKEVFLELGPDPINSFQPQFTPCKNLSILIGWKC